MATIDLEALEHVLASVDLRVGAVRRIDLDAGGFMPLALGSLTVVYVIVGSVTASPASTTSTLESEVERGTLFEGDAFLTLGRSPVTWRSEHGARLMVAELRLVGATRTLADVLPEFVTVTDFVGLEPAAAALAGTMGQTDPTACALRSGDPMICRMMTTTILLTLIRAWAENGCAPDGWPSRSNDPFLDRVVEAIHEVPGREWTVETLAEVGAMSRSVFAERFRSAFGRSPASYVTGVRMDAAKRMLDDGRSVSATSRSLGYGSDEGFSRAFRRATGVTPSAWRMTRAASESASFRP